MHHQPVNTALIVERHRRRLAALDPLVAVPELPDVGARIVASAALAVATERYTDPVSGAGMWQHECVHRLDVRFADEPDPTDLGDLLDEWLAGEHHAADVLEVTLPSRDVSALPALVRRHFSPSGVLALRRSGPVSVPPTGVRAAGPHDLDAMARLSGQLHTYEEQFGAVPHRPEAGPVHRAALTAQLGDHPGWAWVAEDADGVVGMCVVEPPAAAGWVAGATTAAPAAYLSELMVDGEFRGSGVGRALAAAAHRALDAAGVGATLLHHGPVNPLSVPFWARQGYRPLLTTWQRFP